MFYKPKYLQKSLNPVLRILIATNALLIMSGAFLAPIYAIFVEKIGGDLLDASMTASAFALAAGLTTLIVGNLADRLPKRPIVAFGYIVVALSYFGFMFVENIWHLLIVQMFIGFGEAIYSPGFDALFSENMKKSESGRAWGSWEAMNYFAITFGSLVGGFLAISFGFDTLFIMMGFLALVGATYVGLVDFEKIKD